MIENFRYSFEENEIIVKKLLDDGNFFTSNSTLERLIPRTDFNAKNNKVTPIEKILTSEEVVYINQFPDRKYFYFIASHKIEKDTLFCPICGNFRKKYEKSPKVYDTCGNPACYNKLISDKNKNKSPEEKLKIRKKRESFFENKYGQGVINNTQVPEVKEKTKATNLKKFGVEWPGVSDIIKSKIKRTNQERRGVDYPFQSKEVQDKIPQTFLEKYGTKNINAEDLLKRKLNLILTDKNKIFYSFIDFNIASKFLEENNILGTDKFSTINIGAFVDGQIIAVMSLKKISFNKKSTLKGFISFIKDNIKSTLLVECNRRYFSGESYRDLGFVFLKKTKPQAWYIKGYNLFSEEYCKDYFYNNKNPEEFNKGLISLGYRIIYDCGQNVYVKEVKSC